MFEKLSKIDMFYLVSFILTLGALYFAIIFNL